jgi:hypothetical protein
VLCELCEFTGDHNTTPKLYNSLLDSQYAEAANAMAEDSPTLCGCSRQDDGPTDGKWPGATRSRSGPAVSVSAERRGATESPLYGRTRGAVEVPVSVSVGSCVAPVREVH